MANVGKHIKMFRIRKEMTQDELADKLFVSRQTVSNYENNKSQPDIDMLVKVAEALGTDVNTLIYGEPVTPERKREIGVGLIQLALVIASVVAYYIYMNWAVELNKIQYISGPYLMGYYLFLPLIYAASGWGFAKVLMLVFGVSFLDKSWRVLVHRISWGLMAAYFVVFSPYIGNSLGVVLGMAGWLELPNFTAMLPGWWDDLLMYWSLLEYKSLNLTFVFMVLAGIGLAITRQKKPRPKAVEAAEASTPEAGAK